MERTNRERVLDYLWSISPDYATNSQIRDATGIRSPDKDIVSDAKYFTLLLGQRLPPAKFSIIAERVWLLEKTTALTKFLTFGNDRQAPPLWLGRYGHLVSDVSFFFLTDDGELEQLNT